MADPVIVPPSGHTFERSCVQACADLAFSPPGLFLDLSPSSVLLIPNVALKSAILSWCHRCGVPPPQSIPLDVARVLIRSLMPPSTNPRPPPLPLSSDPPPHVGGGTAGRDQRGRGYDEKYEELPASSALPDGNGCRSRRPVQNTRETMIPNTPSAFSVRATNQAPSFSQLLTPSASAYRSSSSNYSITETFVEQAPKEPTPPTSQVQNPTASNLQEEILIRLMDTELSEQESAVVSLRRATRESRDRRIDLCTCRLLAALRSMLLCSSAAVQINATAALVNLSLELENRVRILRSGAVAPLVDVLKGGHPEARDHAAGALFSLSLEDENRAAIGVLGAIPPLLDLFSVASADGVRARRDAGMALYYLSLAVSNRLKIARAPGAVRALLSVALESEEAPVDGAPPPHGPGLARLAMMMVCSLAVCNDGRAALMDGGAVASVVSLMRSPAAAAVEEYCVAALYRMSRGSLRFRGLARSAGAEPVLVRVAYSGSGGEMRRNMAKKTLRAMRGEDYNDAPPQMGFPVDDDGSVVSEGLKSFRGRPNDHGNPSHMKSARF
ncbi:U-box domain-containing protein [Musa troglodytarum]|uniref:RING-type E3 ubiquitin transferase n=2 Tax=Musa troglodytarum TaxID=320322 RepID=A0A9E7HN50_9LILI|nr:U-box domain-containing protein [Musa troglodytarum]